MNSLRHSPRKSSLLRPFFVVVVIFLIAYFGLQSYFSSGVEDMISEAKAEATLLVTSGKVEVKVKESDKWSRIGKEMILFAGDRVRTLGNSEATITYFDDSQTRLDGSTEIFIENMEVDANGKSVIELDMELGRLWARVIKLIDENSKFEVETPTSVATVRGTAFEVEVIKGEDNGKNIEALETVIRVIENEVAIQAIERVIAKDKDGKEVITKKVLASTTLAVGQKTEVKQSDFEDLKKKSKKLEVSRIATEYKSSGWYKENLKRDVEHLIKVQENIKKKIELIESKGFIEKAFLSSDVKDAVIKEKKVLFQINNALDLLPKGSRVTEKLEQSKKIKEVKTEDVLMKSVVPTKTSVTLTGEAYIIRVGDTLSSIARRAGISLNALFKLNPGISPDNLDVGQIIKLHREVVREEVKKVKKVEKAEEVITKPAPVVEPVVEENTRVIDKEKFESE